MYLSNPAAPIDPVPFSLTDKAHAALAQLPDTSTCTGCPGLLLCAVPAGESGCLYPDILPIAK